MFYGREDLLEQFRALVERPIASLVTRRGRRRIGKSTLIEEFARQLSAQTSVPRKPLGNWFDAFARRCV